MVSQENTMNVGNDAAGYIPVEADFKFKHTDGELALDDNFAAQSFWKDVLIRYFKKISAVIGLILIIIITVFAIIGCAVPISNPPFNSKGCNILR